MVSILQETFHILTYAKTYVQIKKVNETNEN